MFTVRVFSIDDQGGRHETVYCGREYRKFGRALTLIHEGGGSTTFDVATCPQIKDIFVENSHGKTIDRIK